MAILNLSEDSFSGDGGRDIAGVCARAARALEDGAAILDLGAESTRPGARAIGFEEEYARLLPALQAVRTHFPAAVLSVDTTKSEIFAAAAAAGADVLNSVAGLSRGLAQAAAQGGASVVITDPGGAEGGDPPAICERLLAAAERAEAAGLAPESILLDPGFGFGKTPDENIALLAALPDFTALGYPALLGASRKSTLGFLTGNPVERREFATAATTALAAAARFDFVRVHDVAAARETLAVADAVARGLRPPSWNETP